MLYKLDSNGYVVNDATKRKIQPYYKPILSEISGLYKSHLGENILSIYIRGSVSVGRAKPYISDIDSVCVVRDKVKPSNLFWTVEASRVLEKKYPKAQLVELAIVSADELVNSKKYKNLRVYLKTQSIRLWGKDILKKIPRVKPGNELAKVLYSDLSSELSRLRKIFTYKQADTKYLYQRRSMKFWCVWLSRVLLRSGLGVIMVNTPIYTQDLKTCYSYFVKEFPEYASEMGQLLKWSIEPIDNRKEIVRFMDSFCPEYLKLIKKVLYNN